MKTLRLISIFLLLLAGTQVIAINVSIQVTGQVVALNPTGQPIPDHLVCVTAFADSINTFTAITDSVLTNANGYYAATLLVPFIPGTSIVLDAATYDCQQYLNHQFITYTGGSAQFTADFAICNDSILPPSNCQNYILVNSIQGLVVTFQGGLYNQQSAAYTWDFGDGTIGSGANIAHNFPTQGTYSVLLSTLTNDGCADTSLYILYLNDTIPPPSLCENYILVNGIQGLVVAFQGGLYNQQSAVYTWEFGDGTTGTGANISHTFPSPGAYNVELSTVTNDSCYDNSFYFLYLNDTINPPLPCDNFISIAGIQGLSVTIYGGMINQQNASYNWDLGDGTTSAGTMVTHTYPAQGTYIVSLTTITNDSCVDVSSTSITLMDSIPNGCNSYFTATTGNTLFEIHFEGITSNFYPTSFVWDFGDPASGINNNSTLQNPDHVFSGQGTYFVTLTTTDSTNCTSTYTAPITFSIFETFILYGQVFAGNEIVTACEVLLFGQDSLGNLNMIQQAYPDSGNVYNFINVGSGIYRILAIPAQGTVYAQGYLPTYFGDEFLWENATPIVLGQPANPYNIHLVPFDSISGGNGIINGGLTTGGKSMNVGDQEILILDNTDTPVKYMFSQADGTFSFAGLPYGEYKVYPVITGMTTYPVTVTLDEANSTATVVMTISGQTIAGIADKVQLISGVYPNPASNFLTISLKADAQKIAQITIRDMTGRVIVMENVNDATSEKQIRIPVDKLLDGIYLVQVTNGKGATSATRFVKLKQ